MATKKTKKRKTKSTSKSKLTLEVTLVPLQGTATTTPHTTAPGIKLGALLTTAGIATDRRDLLVDGKPATGDTVITANAKIQVRERPAGS